MTSFYEAFEATVQPPWDPMYLWLRMLYGSAADTMEFFEYAALPPVMPEAQS